RFFPGCHLISFQQLQYFLSKLRIIDGKSGKVKVLIQDLDQILGNYCLFIERRIGDVHQLVVDILEEEENLHSEAGESRHLHFYGKNKKPGRKLNKTTVGKEIFAVHKNTDPPNQLFFKKTRERVIHVPDPVGSAKLHCLALAKPAADPQGHETVSLSEAVVGKFR